MSKYEPLEFHLRTIPIAMQEIDLTFTDIERVLAQPLPDSARCHREWWANQRDASDRPQAQAWLAAGFEVDAVHMDRPNGLVKFRRR